MNITEYFDIFNCNFSDTASSAMYCIVKADDGTPYTRTELHWGAASRISTKSRPLKAKARIPTQSSKTMGLLTKLPVTVGLQYEICINVVVEDGLRNGTLCVEKYFRVPCSWPAKVQHNMV